MLPLALRFIGACPRQVAQHDAGDTVCAPLGRARRTEVAETRVFMAMRMGVLMDNSPTASWWVVMIAGARFHARTSRRASQEASRASRPGRTSPTKSLQRLSVHLSKLPFLSRLATGPLASLNSAAATDARLQACAWSCERVSAL
jgi:hypothetical protein